MTVTNEELATKIQAGETDLMEELWNQVRAFVVMKAIRRITLTEGLGGVEVDDLIQAGYIALCEAVQRYTGEYKLITYLNTTLKTAFSEAAGIRWGRIANDPINRAAPLDAPIGDDPAGATLADFIKDQVDQFEDADRRIWLEQLHQAIEAALKDLPTSQRETLRRRFWDGQTLKEIGEADGVAYQLVRQRERDALRTIYRKRRRYHLDQFAEENQKYIDERTPWYLQVGPGRFGNTHSSAVEELTLLRERIAAEEYNKRRCML